MENSNSGNINDPNEKPHPKPTDDVGAQIETVTPDTEKEGLPNDQKSNPPKDSKETDHSDVEPLTPDSENDKIPEDHENTPEETNEDGSDVDNQGDIDSKNPKTDQNKHHGDGPEIETVTP
ncbi:hypothetical protein [Pedobacter nyackensis]|nr:hypothetical protein [Pedobacter nyackensis]